MATTLSITIHPVDLVSPLPEIPYFDLSAPSSSNHHQPPQLLEGDSGETDAAPEYSAEPRPGERTAMQAPPPEYRRLPPVARGVHRVRFVVNVEEIPSSNERAELGAPRRHLVRECPASHSRTARFLHNCRLYRLQGLSLAMLLAIILGVILSRFT